MLGMVRPYGVVFALLTSACTAAVGPAETVSIAAVRETAPVASPDDAADDPAVWRNPVDPTKSLIVATDKSWGLNVYDLSGALVASAPAGLVNNVDLRADVLIGGRAGVLVAASDRSENSRGLIALYALDASPVALRHLGDVFAESDGVGKVYGICLWRRSAEELFAVIPFNNGDVRQYALDLSGAIPRAALVRSVKLESQTEGCVADDRTGTLFVAEEERGVWRFDADPDSREAPTLFAAIDGVRLIPDAEGLAIIPQGDTGGILLVSSQADNPAAGSGPVESTIAAYDLEDGRYVRSFRVVGSGTVDGITETDGIEFAPGDFGAPFEDGLLVVQDGDNTPDNQNFKMIPGGTVRRLLGR